MGMVPNLIIRELDHGDTSSFPKGCLGKNVYYERKNPKRNLEAAEDMLKGKRM